MEGSGNKNMLVAAIFIVAFSPASGIGVWMMGSHESQPRSTAIQGDLGVLTDFDLVSQDGRPYGLKDLKGKVWVASFLYSTCKSSCPMVGAEMARLQKLIPPSPDFR